MSKKPKNTKADVKAFEGLGLKPFFPLDGAVRDASGAEHSFWATQDVENVAHASFHVIEPIDKATQDGTPPAHVRPEPYALPPDLQWSEIATTQLDEVHDMLRDQYVGSNGGNWVMHYNRSNWI